MASEGERIMNSGSSSTAWTWEQNKAFEIGLTIYPENSENRWEKIASQIPGHKTLEEIERHYQLLVDDLNLIESGKFPLPNYYDPPEWETRKGQPWTEEEHKQFLLGLEKYGKGDWKTIAKEFVKTRTTTQVASHAQKYFKRQAKKREKQVKRWSIFDITNPNCDDEEEEDYGKKTIEKEKEKIMRCKTNYDGISSSSYPSEGWCPEDENGDEDDDELDLDLEVCFLQLPPL